MNFLNKIFLLSFLILIEVLVCASNYNIALCTVATGKYACFVKGFVDSARKNFLPENNLRIIIFTDQLLPVDGDDITIVRWPHKKWPFSTMMRFKAYHEYNHLFNDCTHVFACDIDAIFVDIIGNEILGKTVGVLHPGYYKKNLDSGTINGLIEKNPKSTIFLNAHQAGQKYFAGGFYGGETAEFKKLVETCHHNITKDLQIGIIAPWHDETHLNYYFLKNVPQVKLTPVYCYPEEARAHPTYRQIQAEQPKIVVLNKEHLQMRSVDQILDDREFVVLIPSYNNIKYYKANLDSVYRQRYKKYRVIYIDDNSSDGTGDAVRDYVKSCGKEAITTIVSNKDRKLALANIYNNVMQNCKDHEVVAILDADDEFADENVLLRLNLEYRNNDIWFTYGNCWFLAVKTVCPWSKSISEHEIELNKFREWSGAATHLRTFYAWIFKKINQKDLMSDGDFFRMTYDVAMFMPILEMSGYHHKFLNEVLYLYNDENPLNDHKINSRLQLDLNKYIRNNLTKYQPITKLGYFDRVLLRDASEYNLEEVAAILNDLIANIANIYPAKEAQIIFDRISYLQDDFVDKFSLVEIAANHDYTYLSAYLTNKDISCRPVQQPISEAIFRPVDNKISFKCYQDELEQDTLLDQDYIKFTQWLGNLIVEQYKQPLTTVKQDINRVSRIGITPLMVASAEGLSDMVRQLLSLGANKHLRSRIGKLAIDYARGHNAPQYRYIIGELSK